MRIAADPHGPEFSMLSQYLDHQRETVLSKTEGLTREQLAQKHSPSELTLAGLLYHLALVEEDWMEVRFAGLPDREPWTSVDWDGDPDWEFRTAALLEPVQLRSRYRAACDRSREVVFKSKNLDQLSIKALGDGRNFSLRWVLLHLIEETARHAGHADFLRESIDGTVGH
ncbi:DinB family protein [Cryobacterium serini]|uniref:DinB family protein n=1 Tax=Cryobacterium serini TaxID=1259201 RepID=A0A4R9BVZ9_9MICO|nr:DinB family protein [Cryobacterium serini]TFD91360.1 DinB family protein [Cryobacterium serini]